MPAADASPGLPRCAGDHGAALVFVLLCTTLVLALGFGAVTLSNLERASAAAHLDGLEALYAADSAAEYVVSELGRAVDWTPYLSGASTSSFWAGATTTMTTVSGLVDLPTLTAALQLQTSAGSHWGANTPRWRLMGHGPLETLAGITLPRSGPYVAFWVADDGGEGDGDVDRDSNGVVQVRAMAFGRRQSRRSVDLLVGRGANPGIVRLLSWHEH